ncbi:MAG: winged helix-turn-helix domain-containing protein [Nitrosopumilus sp.]|nr:winged helix-turn-helix domain-containing protein [Nitrosopumilus sp.]
MPNGHEVDFMMKYGRRGFLEIIAEILTQLQESPTRKTLLSYRCKLDSRAVSKYLEIMEKIDMVERSKENQNFFLITKKGNLYLKKYNSLIEPLLK